MKPSPLHSGNSEASSEAPGRERAGPPAAIPAGMGLRAQIVLALALLFAVSWGLVAFVAVQLTQRARALDELQDVQRLGRLLDEVHARELPQQRFEQLLGQVMVAFDLQALKVRDAKGRVVEAGNNGGRPGLSVPLRRGGRLTLWHRAARSARSDSLARLLLFYVVFTGGAILLLTYFALTHLIVRPLDQLTRASERLPSASVAAQIPKRSAAEVQRLNAAINDMASKLRAERAAMQRRLRELEETTRELRQAEGHLTRSAKLASVGRLAAGVAHEIGNPLAAILGFVELLGDADLDQGQRKEFLARIGGETERIHRIIRDLLDFSRPPHNEGADLTSDPLEAVRDAINLIRPQKEMRAIELRERVAPGLFRVPGAQHRLTQVVLNLLLNAVDALKGKGQILVELGPNEDRTMLLLSVTDDGPGIPPQMLDLLFEPFSTTKSAGKGTGLGLAVSHTLVSSLGGSITASSGPKGGARFEVRLPRASRETPTAEGSPST